MKNKTKRIVINDEKIFRENPDVCYRYLTGHDHSTLSTQTLKPCERHPQ